MNEYLRPSPDLAEAIDLEQVKPRYRGMGDEKLYHVLRSIALKRPTFSPHPGDQLLLQRQQPYQRTANGG